MKDQKTRDAIDLELSRTYFGTPEEKSPPAPQKKAEPEEEKQETQHAPFPARRRWSPLTILFILWILSSIIFFAGYFLRGKKVVFNVAINVEPDPAYVKRALSAKKERPSKEDFLSRIIRQTAPKQVSVPGSIVPGSIPIETDSPNSKTLYGFEIDEGGWEIPSWELDKPDHVARSLGRTDAFSNTGNGSLELYAEFPGKTWTAALIEVQQYLNLENFDTIQADIYVPPSCPEGLRCKLILTVGEDWRFVEMARSFRLTPGEWTTVKASIADGSKDWKRTIVDNVFKGDVRKIAIRIESNQKPVYSGPIYIDNVRVTSQ
ncbi:MAG: hypothetical protein ACE5JK_07180 [Candidatus Omnitrophota bacterium]